jgi:multiple sugar transport system ATP-binding protein
MDSTLLLPASKRWRRAYEGRTVILSIRPEDLEDAALASDTPSDRRLHGNVVLCEGLGSEIVAHFDIDARPALTDDVRELAADVGEELTVQAPHTRMVGRFGAGSAVHGDQEAEMAVDTRALHFFDPDTGAGIYDTDSRRS